MAITHVGTGAQVTGTGALTPTYHGGYTAVAGDWAEIWMVGRGFAGGPPAVPSISGWTLIGGSFKDDGGDPIIYCLAKILTASEAMPSVSRPANWTQATSWAVQVVIRRGTDVPTALDVTVNAQSANASTDFTPTSVTTVTDGACIVAGASSAWSNAITIKAGSTQGFTQRFGGASYDVASQYAICMIDLVKATAGSQTIGTFTQTVDASDPWASITFAIKPEDVGGAVELVVADATHSHTVDAVALTQHHVLTVADATHSHSVDALALTVELIVADATHGHSADAITLTQHHVLAVADATHGHTADAVVLTQHHVLVVADATHGHSADNITVTPTGEFVVDAATHSQTVDSVVLTQHHVLVVADAVHGHTADAVALTQHYAITVASAEHGHTVAAVILTHNQVLVVADATHSHTADAVALTQHHILVVADALHAHTAEPALFQVPIVGGVGVGSVRWRDGGSGAVTSRDATLATVGAAHSGTGGTSQP